MRGEVAGARGSRAPLAAPPSCCDSISVSCCSLSISMIRGTTSTSKLVPVTQAAWPVESSRRPNTLVAACTRGQGWLSSSGSSRNVTGMAAEHSTWRAIRAFSRRTRATARERAAALPPALRTSRLNAQEAFSAHSCLLNPR